MYASKDYQNTAEGGLSFKTGDSVYVLLRNQNGVCTGTRCSKYFFIFEIIIYASKPLT